MRKAHRAFAHTSIRYCECECHSLITHPNILVTYLYTQTENYTHRNMYRFLKKHEMRAFKHTEAYTQSKWKVYHVCSLFICSRMIASLSFDALLYSQPTHRKYLFAYSYR